MRVPSRILMTADTLGGVWSYSMELAAGLAAHDIQVSLATMGSSLSSQQRLEAERCGVDIHESQFKLEWMNDPWNDVDTAGDWLLDLAEKIGPDLVHLNNFSHGSLPWRVPTVMVGHSCVFSWWKAVHKSAPPADWSEYHRRVQYGIGQATVVIGVSRAMLRELEYWYGPIDSSFVVYNGYPSNVYRSTAKENFILSCGRLWDAGKNMGALAKAAKTIPWPVCVAGDPQHPDGGSRSLPNVLPLGLLKSADLQGWYAKAPIYALPALYEPFGLSVLEAALSECALVLGDIPSLRELWDGAALFIPATNCESLSAAINWLIDAPAIRMELGKRAKARALTFSRERMVNGYLDAYAFADERHRNAKGVVTSCVL